MKDSVKAWVISDGSYKVKLFFLFESALGLLWWRKCMRASQILHWESSFIICPKQYVCWPRSISMAILILGFELSLFFRTFQILLFLEVFGFPSAITLLMPVQCTKPQNGLLWLLTKTKAQDLWSYVWTPAYNLNIMYIWILLVSRPDKSSICRLLNSRLLFSFF